MRDELSSSDFDIIDLWIRGKFWEIFGFANGDFTTLELAKQYSAILKEYRNSSEDMRLIDDAFATLNAPLTRQFYEGCRMVMQRIRREMGNKKYQGVEDRIWPDLWSWVSERWQEPPEELINAIRTKYSSSSVSDKSQAETWSDEGLKPADLDSVMAAEAFVKEIKCQGCGKFDHTLRAVAFPYVVSILIASFRRAGESGIFCHSCRCTKSLKWAIVSLLFGWWSIWGFFWNIGALIDNLRGGKMPRENNEPLITRLAWANMVLGKIAEAKAALKELRKYGPSGEALQLQRELDAKYPEIAPARTGEFRLGYLTVVFAILGIYVIAGIAMFGGESSTPAAPSQVTPSFTTPTQPSSIPTPTADSTDKYIGIYYDDLLQVVNSFVGDISPYIKINQSDKDAMSMLMNKLKERNIETGLVSINSELDAPGNLDYCVAVKTTDRNTVFMTILPSDLDLADDSERLQFVYLEEGEEIGIIPAKFSVSNSYEWYKNYLEEVYANWDYGEYISEFGNIVDKNKTELDKLSSKIDELIDFAENPNISIYDSAMSQAQIDAKYNSLLGEVDALIDQYNSYPDQYNAQVEEYNAKLDSYIIESEKYPYELFYVEEYSINPNRISFPISPIPIPMPMLIPYTPVPIAPFNLYSIDTYLNALQDRVNRDYSYNILPEPDKSRFKAERITDKNFIVNEYKIKW